MWIFKHCEINAVSTKINIPASSQIFSTACPTCAAWWAVQVVPPPLCRLDQMPWGLWKVTSPKLLTKFAAVTDNMKLGGGPICGSRSDLPSAGLSAAAVCVSLCVCLSVCAVATERCALVISCADHQSSRSLTGTVPVLRAKLFLRASPQSRERMGKKQKVQKAHLALFQLICACHVKEALVWTPMWHSLRLVTYNAF